ncbi:acyl-CoA thioesterase [Sneathiella sp.]|jgi:4-hydroxybenzoyl-CoA thioesterase|uniref:acyl-CoA thioesterase n=1 Tax=Sneathiella sp. TaxID=1964365 RepID=UPI0039E43989
MTPFRYQQQVLFQHCDPAGIVFYPRYFEMVNATVENWFEKVLKVPFADLHMKRHSAVPTATIKTTFKAPSRLGDVLMIDLSVEKIGGASLDLSLIATAETQTRFETFLTLVHMDMNSGKPTGWPTDIRTVLTKLMEEAS